MFSRAIATFPSRFIVPKAIYRFSKITNSKEVRKIFNNIGSIQYGRGYLGKIIKLKTNPKSKRYLQILFRAPYKKVDKVLLQQMDIENEEQ